MTALREAVIAGLSRLLTLVDRGPFSPSRGSADRPFWHYRTDKDYPSATYAQVAWPLALLATRPGLGVSEHLRPALAGLALDAMRWWAEIGHRDGSRDEWFAYERSQVATAFTTFAVAEAASALGERFTSSPERATVAAALARSARWLERNRDLAVANHAAGAVAAFASVEALLPGTAPGAAARELDRLLSLQDDEGFLPEYGGADPGYASVSLAFLAHARRHLESPALDRALARLADFVAAFVNPDGSFGGEHGRRGTRYAWLSGLALLAPAYPEAASALARLLAGLAAGSLASPLAYDDRYFAFFAYPDAVLTLAALAGTVLAEQAVAAPGVSLFPHAGLGVYRSVALHVVVGAAVGGVVKAFATSPALLLLDDCGYAGQLRSGTLVSSWRFGARSEVKEGHAIAAGDFSRWTRASPVARHPLLSRLVNHTLGRVPAVSRLVAGVAKSRFTARPRTAPLTLRREIQIEESRVTITDHLSLAAGVLLGSLRRVAGFAPVHVPSAPLWVPAFAPRLPADGPEIAPLLVPGGALAVTTTLSLERGVARLSVAAGGRAIAAASTALERG